MGKDFFGLKEIIDKLLVGYSLEKDIILDGKERVGNFYVTEEKIHLISEKVGYDSVLSNLGLKLVEEGYDVKVWKRMDYPNRDSE